jgi:hypothetical protein
VQEKNTIISRSKYKSGARKLPMSSQKPRKEQEIKSTTEKVRKVKEKLKDPNVVHKVCTITSSRGKLCIQEIR